VKDEKTKRQYWILFSLHQNGHTLKPFLRKGIDESSIDPFKYCYSSRTYRNSIEITVIQTGPKVPDAS